MASTRSISDARPDPGHDPVGSRGARAVGLIVLCSIRRFGPGATGQSSECRGVSEFKRQVAAHVFFILALILMPPSAARSLRPLGPELAAPV